MTPLVLPLDSLLIRLRQHDMAIDPSVRVKVQLVLNQLGKEYLDRPEQLKLILGPVLVNNEAEQELFREVFDQWFQEEILFEAEIEEEENQSNSEDLNVKGAIQKRRVWLYPIAGIAVIFFLGLFNYFNQSIDFDTEIQETQAIDLSNTPNKDKLNKIDQTNDSPVNSSNDPVSKNIEVYIEDSEDLYVGKTIHFSLRGASIPENSTVIWDWGYKDGSSAQGINTSYQYKKPGIYDVLVEIPLASGYESIMKTVVIQPKSQSVQALYQIQLEENEAKQAMIKLLVTFIAFFLIVFIEGYLYNYGRSIYTLAFRREFSAEEQGNFKLPFPAQNQTLEAEPALYELAQNLKYRYAGHSTALDIPATINATVKSGGLPDLQYTTRTEPSEYLVLIDESGPEDYQAKLFEQLMLLLKQEEVPIHIFRFRNDPRYCYNHLFPNGLELEALAQRFYRHKLLIFSKGTFLINPSDNQLHEWVGPLMKRWGYRALLTPEPVAEWSIRERALQSCFTLLPTDLQSQKGITEALLAEDQPDFDQLKEELLVKSHHGTPLEDYDFESIYDLQDYLGDAVFRWLAATSVYPEPRWEMTLKIGQALENEIELIGVVNENYGDDFTTSSLHDSRKLVTYENLTKLSSIPWLREGNMSPEIRSLLQKNLDPETEKMARNAVLEMIEEVNTNEHSGIKREKKIQKLIQESALNPQEKLLSKKLRFLWSENLLSKENTESLPKHLQPSWQMELMKNLPVKKTFLAMSSIFLLGISAWQGYQYSQQDLFAQYFQPFPAAESVIMLIEGKEVDSYKLGMTAYKAKDYQKAARYLGQFNDELIERWGPEPNILSRRGMIYRGISFLGNNQSEEALDIFAQNIDDPLFGRMAKWYSSLAYIAQDQKEAAQSLLMELAVGETGDTYQILAREVLEDL